MAKTALITGITGQDGSYLAELLLSKGYKVVGAVRRLSAPNQWRIAHLQDQITLRQADLLDQMSLIKVMQEAEPDEVYNLAAMSFVPASWDQPMLTGEFNSQGVTRVLEAIRQVNPKIKFYQASSSEMYGKVREVPQSELTPFYPRSPYTTVRATACSPARASCSTTSRRAAGSSSSPGRSPTAWRASSAASPTRWPSATSTPSATGDSRATTCAPCG